MYDYTITGMAIIWRELDDHNEVTVQIDDITDGTAELLDEVVQTLENMRVDHKVTTTSDGGLKITII